MRSDRQARLECSWFAAMPAMVLQSPNRIENTDWWSANKRRKTLKKKHRNPGMTPRFKKRRDDLYFVCWHNKGANANYRRLNRHHGEVVITGQNPGAYRLDGQPCRYSIHIRVRVSQPIRDYTSVGVNWTRRTLVFVNDPLPIGRERTGAMVGLDRGCVHTLATSDNRFIDLPKQRLERIDREICRRQKAQARRVNMSGKTVREYRRNPSHTYERTGRELSRLYAKAHRIIDDWQHKTGGMEYEIHATRDGAYGPVDYTTPLPGGLTFAGMLAATRAAADATGRPATLVDDEGEPVLTIESDTVSEGRAPCPV